MTKRKISEVMAHMGRKGGQSNKGKLKGPMVGMTPEQRSIYAQMMLAARRAKREATAK